MLNFPKTQELHGLVLWCDSDPNILSQCDVLRGSGLEVQHFQSPEAREAKKGSGKQLEQMVLEAVFVVVVVAVVDVVVSCC